MTEKALAAFWPYGTASKPQTEDSARSVAAASNITLRTATVA